ncbi:unnamed protein product, partial [Linum tenue]
GRTAGAKRPPPRSSRPGATATSSSTGETSARPTGNRSPPPSTPSMASPRRPTAPMSSARTGSTPSRRSTRSRRPGSPPPTVSSPPPGPSSTDWTA